MTVRFKRIHPQAVLPKYAHPDDAGMDLCASEAVLLAPGCSALIRTGLVLELPADTEAQVRPRSGLALRHGLTLLNAPGTIDAGYRGEIGVILINHGHAPFQIEPGMRIAQMVIAPVLRVCIEEVDAVSDTMRGTGGFGSTGTHTQI